MTVPTIEGPLWLYPSALIAVVLFPTANEFLRRCRPFGEKELEMSGQQTTRHDASAFQHKFRFAPQKERPDFQHPCGSRQSDARAPRFAQGLHEFAVRKRIWRRQIDHAREIFPLDQELDCAYEVSFVNPRNELFAGPLRSAEAASH